MKSIVVAYDKKLGIGANNDLLWQRDLPADLLNFKNITNGYPIIMGRKTYESIGKPLPGRRNIIISRDYQADGVEIVDSLQSAYDITNSAENVFIIGGEQIFNLSMDSIDTIYATEVDATFDQATVFFPIIDKNTWKETSRIKNSADDKNLYNYDFVVYERR